MFPTLNDITTLIYVLVWPVVIISSVIIFRKPLSVFLEQLGLRATKFSIAKFSVELPEMPAPQNPWEDPSLYGSSNLIAGQVDSTTINELFKRIRDITTWDYLVVDIGAGRRWLVSRLFLFAAILEKVRQIKCVVFVESKGNVSRSFIGIASPESVYGILEKKYPYFSQAYTKAYFDNQVSPLPKHLPTDQAENIVNAFMSNEEIQKKQEPEEKQEWEELGESNTWEHTSWVDKELVESSLRVYDRDTSTLKDTPDTAHGERIQAILRRDVPFVALINKKGEFKGLIDRAMLIRNIAKRLAEAS